MIQLRGASGPSPGESLASHSTRFPLIRVGMRNSENTQAPPAFPLNSDGKERGRTQRHAQGKEKDMLKARKRHVQTLAGGNAL